MSTATAKRSQPKAAKQKGGKRDLPSRMCYMRSINTSVGYFFSAPALDSDERDFRPVLCHEAESRRGVARAFNDPDSSADPETLRARTALFRADGARLPRDHDALVIRFGLNVFRNAFSPADCNDFPTAEALEGFAKAYADSGAVSELARRYVFNLANGAWLWRNRQGFRHRIVIHWDECQATACPHDDATRLAELDTTGTLQVLAERLARALSEPGAALRIQVESRTLLGGGHDVFPSQLHVDNPVRSRYLASEGLPDGTQQVIFNGRKIANALHRIDDWYDPDAQGKAPMLAVEPFAPDRRRQQAMRVVHRNDFYTLLAERLDALVAACRSAKTPTEVPGDAHFLMACLIRGGSFSGKSKKS